MSGFVATSGKYEVYAPGSDTYVLFNDSQDINAVSSLTFTKGTATLKSAIFHTGADGTDINATSSIAVGAADDLGMYHNGSHSFIENNTGDLTILTDGSGAGIILDAEDDTVEIKYSGTTGATFGTGGLNIVSGDTYQINGTAVVAATGAAALQTSAVTGLSALGSGQVASDTDVLLIYDDNATAFKKVTPDNLGISAGGGGGSDALARALKTLSLVEIDAS
ncbi:MAG: hypothetical protein QGH83_15985 [Candidatus Pacebacteria bacterium]|jgi:hypothetical protein|nr:hypothetical protein [Candidatus Paceibacterota bacterium]|tara:strand:+ start:596 stop:1261 length:666 start_codon:yes stop_codon:yes gene_type:complete